MQISKCVLIADLDDEDILVISQNVSERRTACRLALWHGSWKHG